jgi:outer membrane receptor protein involved in Fe transport
VGGNPDLGPETADSTQFGVILNPIENLSITVDAWEYEIENTIGSIGVGTILGGCYYSSNRNYCDKVQRDANGLIQNIFAATANIGEVETAGYDIQANYDLDLNDWGSLSLGLDWTVIDTYEIRSPGSDGVSTNVTDCVGVYDCGTLIENRWILDARWKKGDLTVRGRLNYYDNFDECEDDFCNGGTARREIDNVAYISLGVGYDLGQGTRLGLNVSNLTDEDPPRIYNGFYSGADVAYDFMGRYYMVSINHTF